MNQRSSARTARRKTRFVVRRGRMGVPSGVERENFRGRGAKRERVPVPVLFENLVFMVLLDSDWMGGYVPIWTVFTSF